MNRITPPSRQPLDPLDRLERANTDVQFVLAMRKCGHDGFSLDGIHRRAVARCVESRRELEAEVKKENNQ